MAGLQPQPDIAVCWGFFVVSGVDNVLRPYLISHGSNLPLILMFFGVLGGVMAFGFLGVFWDRLCSQSAMFCSKSGVVNRGSPRTRRTERR
jgi:hypothetical protein